MALTSTKLEVPIKKTAFTQQSLAPQPSLKVARYLIEELKMDKERLDGEQQTALDVASKMVEWFGGADSIELVQLLTE